MTPVNDAARQARALPHRRQHGTGPRRFACVFSRGGRRRYARRKYAFGPRRWISHAATSVSAATAPTMNASRSHG